MIAQVSGFLPAMCRPALCLWLQALDSASPAFSDVWGVSQQMRMLLFFFPLPSLHPLEIQNE